MLWRLEDSRIFQKYAVFKCLPPTFHGQYPDLGLRGSSPAGEDGCNVFLRSWDFGNLSGCLRSRTYIDYMEQKNMKTMHVNHTGQQTLKQEAKTALAYKWHWRLCFFRVIPRPKFLPLPTVNTAIRLPMRPDFWYLISQLAHFPALETCLRHVDQISS